jgi:hypothetical protein
MELLVIQKKIYELRGHRIMLDFDLAVLYGVETKVLKQAVKRNIQRFPADFMFELNYKEVINLRSQFVTSSWGGTRYKPFAFTEQGVAMLASILNSSKAIQVNISIIRAFIALRQFALDYKELSEKIAALEKKHNKKFADVYEAIDLLLYDKETREEWEKRKRIGFKLPKK